MLPEKCKLEWKRNTSTPIRMAQIPNADNRKCWEGWEVQEFPFTAGRKGKWHSRFGGWSGSFFHNKTNLSTGSISCSPWYLPKCVEHLCPHKNLHTNIYSSFIHNCQNLEATTMFFSKQMDKYTVLHPNNKTIFIFKAWKNFKCLLGSEKSQSEEATYCVFLHVLLEEAKKQIENKWLPRRDGLHKE